MELEEILEDHKRQVEIKIRQVLTEIVGGLVSAVTDAIDALNTAEAALQQALANNTSLADNAAAVTAIDGATTVMNAAAEQLTTATSATVAPAAGTEPAAPPAPAPTTGVVDPATPA